MKITGTPSLPANTPAPAAPKSPNPPPNPDLSLSKAPHRPQQRRTRLKKAGAPSGKRSSRPGTPLLKWKTEEREANAFSIDDEKDEVSHQDARRRRRRREFPLSARKLAAVLWRLNLPDSVASGGGSGRLPRRRGEEDGGGNVALAVISHRSSTKVSRSEAKDPAQSPTSVSGTRNGFIYKLDPSFQLFNSAMEGATKWDPISLNASEEVQKMYSHFKLLDRQVGTASVISTLEVELEQAQARIIGLETERRNSKKKLELFLKKVSEEKAAWRRREHEKIRAFIDDVKCGLNRERKIRQRMEIVNSKLVDELAEAKLSAKRYMQDYEKEKKTREMIEEVCDELVKEMGEDKAEFEAMKNESMKFRYEVEEERRMLQMAEVWREERVQMKLVDAKVALEEKYSQMNNLVANLENVLNKHRNSNPDSEELIEAELLQKATASVNVKEVNEFRYEPSNPDDIFAVLEEVDFAENNERDIESCLAYISPASKIHTVSPEVGVVRDPMSQKRHPNTLLNCNKGDNNEVDDDESGWETVSNLEDQGSSYSPESVIKNRGDTNVSGSGSETTGISEVCSAPAKQVKNDVSSIARLWRSRSNNGESLKYKVVSTERMNNDGCNSASGQWSSPETGNHRQMTRAMKGCIDWPLGAQKNSLKAKLLEARMESQKVQLRQVLKQKM